MPLLEFDTLQIIESTIKSKNGQDGMRTWSTAVQILLPVAALAIFWGRRGLITKFLMQFDKNCISVFCPSYNKKRRFLQWANGRLTPIWTSDTERFVSDSIEFWKDGSLLCTLINSAIPGACPNPYRHWRQPPSHGQSLAYKYLGVVPVFTENDLSGNNPTSQQARLLLNYLVRIQESITKISVNRIKYSTSYVVRGMGLITGEQHRKTYFYIYSNNISNSNDVIVSIRAPYDVHSSITIPARCISIKSFRLHSDVQAYQGKAQKYFFKSLSLDLCTTSNNYYNNNQKHNINNEIPMRLIIEKDRVKVIYIAKDFGIHEISITCKGCHLLGSPFSANILINTSGIFEAFIEKPVAKKFKGSKKKIVSKIIDFIDNKISCKDVVPEVTTVQARNVVRGEENPQNSYTNGTIESSVTSPILPKYIEDEVISEVDSNFESFKVPRTNFKKRKLEKRGVVDLEKRKEMQYVSSSFQHHGHYDESPIKTKDIIQPNTMNILNFISSLKKDDSKLSSSIQHSTNQPSSNPDEDYKSWSGAQFKKRLNYWENKTNIGTSEVERNFHYRNSLPEIIFANSTFSFRQHQEYWSTIDTQSLSRSNLATSTSLYYLENAGKYFLKNCSRTRHSLPNIFSDVQREKLLNNHPTDFFESPEAVNFKMKFRECREYWEKLSSQNTNVNFCGSLPNLTVPPKNNTSDNSTFKQLYQQRLEYWKRLSAFALSDLNLTDYSRSFLQYKTPINSTYNTYGRTKYQKCKTDIQKPNCNNGVDGSTEYLNENLTDDLKGITDPWDKMKIYYRETREFFKTLENNQSKDKCY